MTALERSRRGCRRFGWLTLAAWATFGLVLESLHGLKLAEYLDDPLARELLVLAHAHGVGLALVVLAFGEAGAPLFSEAGDGGTSLVLRAGALTIPLAFGLSAIDHPEGDPNALIWMVPVGAILVIAALARTALAALRS
jgi:hypothetical protein